ncbi:hypothetical protein MASR1M32_33530 [Rhodobacter sp.]
MTRFATLTFDRKVAAPVNTLWQAWTAPAARALWSTPTPEVTVEILESAPRAGGREVSICRGPRPPEIRCEAGWLEMQPGQRSVNYEVISAEGVAQSAALVTADFAPRERAAGWPSPCSCHRWPKTWRRATGRALTAALAICRPWPNAP